MKVLREITQRRLKNIGLYYLKRFESSAENLRAALRRRVDKYAFQEPDFDKAEAYGWIDEIVEEFRGYGYIDDARYTDIKIKAYAGSGKSEKYIRGKLKQKGIDEGMIESILAERDYDPFEAALKFAKKKKVGPFREDEDERKEFRQKDMAKLVQAGFDYDTVMDILDWTK